VFATLPIGNHRVSKDWQGAKTRVGLYMTTVPTYIPTVKDMPAWRLHSAGWSARGGGRMNGLETFSKTAQIGGSVWLSRPMRPGVPTSRGAVGRSKRKLADGGRSTHWHRPALAQRCTAAHCDSTAQRTALHRPHSTTTRQGFDSGTAAWPSLVALAGIALRRHSARPHLER
jgi:hypothetical protein